MITEYSQEFKESILQKFFSNPSRSIVSFKKKNGKIMGSKKHKNQWRAEKKFEAVLETAPMGEAEKNEYCRKL